MNINVKEYLVSKNIRPSVQRLAVMAYLLEYKTHPTVDEIFLALNPTIPTLSRTTIYNTLDLFVDRGAVIMLDIDTKFKRYDGDTSLHAHFMCDICSHVSDIKIENSSFVDGNAPQGAKIRDVQLLYKGICDRCNML